MSEWSPNRRSRGDVKPRLIVLHSTGGSFESAVNWFLSRQSGVSAHYVISRKGEVRKMVPLSCVAWHAGVAKWNGHLNVNELSIGIEMEHIDGKQDWPEAQLDAVEKLVKSLKETYGIEAVVGHFEVARPKGRKVDPVGFPWDRVR